MKILTVPKTASYVCVNNMVANKESSNECQRKRDCEKRVQRDTKLGAGTVALLSLICLEKGVLRTYSIRKNARDYFEGKD